MTKEQLNEFKRLYVDENKSRVEISKTLNIGLGIINTIVVKHNIRKRKSYGGVEKIKELYIDKELPASQIAKLLNIKMSTVTSCIQNNGLKRGDGITRRKPVTYSE